MHEGEYHIPARHGCGWCSRMPMAHWADQAHSVLQLQVLGIQGILHAAAGSHEVQSKQPCFNADPALTPLSQALHPLQQPEPHLRRGGGIACTQCPANPSGRGAHDSSDAGAVAGRPSTLGGETVPEASAPAAAPPLLFRLCRGPDVEGSRKCPCPVGSVGERDSGGCRCPRAC